MDFKIENALIIEGLLVGPPQQGMSVFLLLFRDREGTQRYTIMGCRPNFAEGIAKAFQRITTLKPPGFDKIELTGIPEKELENEIGVTNEEKPDTNASPDVRPTTNSEAVPV